MNVNANLLIYFHWPTVNAPTIMEHINAFKKYSKFYVHPVNVNYGFPKKLNKIKFNVITLHYSLFGIYPFKLNDQFKNYLKKQVQAKIISFHQDEYYFCKERFGLINEINIDTVFSLLNTKYHDQVYKKNSNVKNVKNTLTGYVDDSLIQKSNNLHLNNDERKIDFGYRARHLPFFMGKGAQEKTNIAIQFNKRLKKSNYILDIKTKEEDRIYGDNWHAFVSNCKAMIGVEAGVSIFDLKGEVKILCEKFLKSNPNSNFNNIYEKILKKYEDNIFYRTISPRVFECAAFRTCMILFEGKYNGIIQPNIHYIPLKKDFSNFEKVMLKFQDLNFREKLIENAYNDLIKNNKYSYESFINQFDNYLIENSVFFNIKSEEISIIKKLINSDLLIRKMIWGKKQFIPFLKSKIPFKNSIKKILKIK